MALTSVGIQGDLPSSSVVGICSWSISFSLWNMEIEVALSDLWAQHCQGDSDSLGKPLEQWSLNQYWNAKWRITEHEVILQHWWTSSSLIHQWGCTWAPTLLTGKEERLHFLSKDLELDVRKTIFTANEFACAFVSILLNWQTGRFTYSKISHKDLQGMRAPAQSPSAAMLCFCYWCCKLLFWINRLKAVST